MTATIIPNPQFDGTFTAWTRDGVYYVARDGEVIGQRKSGRAFAFAKAIRENGGDRWRIAYGNNDSALASAARAGAKRGITSFAVVIDVTEAAPAGQDVLTTTRCGVEVTEANAESRALLADVTAAGCPIPEDCVTFTLDVIGR